MTRLVVFQTPHDLWCFRCDSDGKIVDCFPATMRRYLGSNIEEVSLVASSVLRYPMERVSDNEYPTRFDITHCGEEVEVKQNGLKMRYAEEYTGWNSEAQSLIVKVIDTPFYNEACAICGIPRDLHLSPNDPDKSTPETNWGDLNRCKTFVRCNPPRAAYGVLGK